jgi:hypothetical protein
VSGIGRRWSTQGLIHKALAINTRTGRVWGLRLPAAAAGRGAAAELARRLLRVMARPDGARLLWRRRRSGQGK